MGAQPPRLACDATPAFWGGWAWDKADIKKNARYPRFIVGFAEAALEVRKARTSEDIARAVALDEAHLGSNERADYIKAVAETGGLRVAVLRDGVQAFCCLDHGYFFEKPFVSLLVVSVDARRRGLGAGLLTHVSTAFSEVWTSTNRSNAAMRKLLDKAGWRYCGEVNGLDEGDPERFYKTG